MRVKYNKLWHLLIERNISRSELRKMAGIAPNTLTRLNKNLDVSMETIKSICFVLKCDIGEVMEYEFCNEE